MAKENIHRAMGSLAYSIAMADGEVQSQEKDIILKLAQKEFELSDTDNEWIKKMFEQLAQNKTSLEDAYNYAIDVLEANRHDYDFDDEMKKKCVNFMKRIADAFSEISSSEDSIIHRFEEDMSRF
ncbi:MAG: hypothetical protein JWO58_985 [Chitinophagaceae bacterium]|nr:hypothetical protein [Chitinophagaceae bacterium]